MSVAHEAMTVVELLIRGAIVGLAIAAPVGPVNVLCIQRTIEHGWRSGVVAGLGSAAADTIYGAVAGFSISLVIGFLVREEFWIRLCGGILLVLIGIWYYFKKPQPLTRSRRRETRTVASTFFLTLTNPTTVLSFLVVLAALGLAQSRSWWLTLIMVGGIFCGSMLWWLILAAIVHRLRRRIGPRAMLWLNRIGGIAIGGFGVASIFLSLFRQ